MKPIFLDMLPVDEPDDEQETSQTFESQPKTILIDDYEIAMEHPEQIIWKCPDIIPSRNCFAVQGPSRIWDGRPYKGDEGYSEVPEDLPMLVLCDEDVVTDNSP